MKIDEGLVNWIGAIILIIGLVSTTMFMVVYSQDHETLREQCFDDCASIFSDVDEKDCVDKCFELDNGSIQKGIYSKLIMDDVR